MMLKEGLSHTSVLIVTEAYTAQALGSGDLPVLGTPAMLALMENAAMLAVANELEEGQTTVGGYLGASHVKPSKLGATVEATATLTKVDRRKLSFHVVAKENGCLLYTSSLLLQFAEDWLHQQWRKDRFLSIRQ